MAASGRLRGAVHRGTRPPRGKHPTGIGASTAETSGSGRRTPTGSSCSEAGRDRYHEAGANQSCRRRRSEKLLRVWTATQGWLRSNLGALCLARNQLISKTRHHHSTKLLRCPLADGSTFPAHAAAPADGTVDLPRSTGRFIRRQQYTDRREFGRFARRSHRRIGAKLRELRRR
jgi:hypothetical protein